jgi:diaminopimelate decarboxylase
MLALFPGGTRIAAGVLELDGIPVTDLAKRFGTPLVVYAEDAVRERARMFQRAAPDALVV